MKAPHGILLKKTCCTTPVLAGVRASFHLYNDESDVDALTSILSRHL